MKIKATGLYPSSWGSTVWSENEIAEEYVIEIKMLTVFVAVFTHGISTAILWDELLHYPHFSNEETEACRGKLAQELYSEEVV